MSDTLLRTAKENGGGQLVEIFWTGGFDSTFRMLQLSRMDVTVQPYYLADDRDSEENELNAMRVIAEKLRARPETKFHLLPLIVVPKSERPENAQITQTYLELRKQVFFGTQYDWLARFAELHPRIELSVHKDDKALEVIQKYGALKRAMDGATGETYVLDGERSTPELRLLFEKYRLPLAGMTKLEMRKTYCDWGCKDIMDDTWFCFTPVNGKPCGHCNPCCYTIQEGMWRRLPPQALVRYGYYSARGLAKRCLKKIVGR